MTSRSPRTSFSFSPPGVRRPSLLRTLVSPAGSRTVPRPRWQALRVRSRPAGVSTRTGRRSLPVAFRTRARAYSTKRVVSGIHDGSARHPVFMFSGQGSQYADMGRELYITWPVFRREVDRCAELLAPRLGHDLRAAIFSREREFEGVDRHRDRAASTIHRGVRVGTSADDARARPGRHHRPQHRRVRVRLRRAYFLLRTPSRSSRSAGA